MSLINKMLQDLDARGSQGSSALQSEIKPVAVPERRLPVKQVAIGSAVLVGAMAVAGVLWLKKSPVAPPVVVIAPAPAPVALPAGPISAQVPLSEAQVRAMAAPAPLSPVPSVAPVVAASVPAAVVPAPVASIAAPRKEARAKAAPTATSEEDQAESEARVRVARVVRVPAPEAPAPARATVLVAPLAGGRIMNDAQRSETQYRQALAALEEGRVASAMDMLAQTLKTNPRHDAARQSLAALLIEAGRNDEAMQQLEQGLALDAAQPSMAMLLARMQIERGASGVATLLRTLPSVGGNADYHAFLAGALQRDGRHKEAVVQYAAALRSAPDNGVWLMGAGISLQADKRNAESLEAFRRAKASGTLSAPLMQFVERKIAQLTP